MTGAMPSPNRPGFPMPRLHDLASRRWVAYASLLAAMLLWSGSFIGLKIAFRSWDPMVVIFGRMAVASFCFLFFHRILRKVIYRPGTWKALLCMAICEPCLYFVLEARALENTSASQAGIVVATLPLLVAVAARFFLNEPLTRRNLIGLFIAIVGTCWLSVTSEATESAPNPMLGNLLEFVAMFCATGYIVILKRMTAYYPPLFLTAVQAVVGCAFFLPLLFLPSTTLPTALDIEPVLAVVYLGACVTLAAYGCYNFSLSRIPAGQASVFVNLIPVFTVFLGWLILDEQLTPRQYGAALLIFWGVWFSQESR